MCVCVFYNVVMMVVKAGASAAAGAAGGGEGGYYREGPPQQSPFVGDYLVGEPPPDVDIEPSSWIDKVYQSLYLSLSLSFSVCLCVSAGRTTKRN